MLTCANPAGYMPETTGAGDPIYKGKDWGELWASSSQQRKRTQDYSIDDQSLTKC